jgi:acetylglutamate kinase
LTRFVIGGGGPQLHPGCCLARARARDGSPGSLVVVHGGGVEVSTLQRLYGVESRFSGGRRVTSVLDLEIIRMALSGSANKRLVAALVDAGVAAVGISGEDAALLVADPLDPDQYGHVGTPAGVNTALLRHLLDGGYLPVVSPVSRSTDAAMGPTLNVNGDDAAAAIAVALGADELLLVSDVAGVLLDDQPVAALGPDDAQKLIDDGTARGGMAAKLQAGLAALTGGVQRVRISDIAAIEAPDRGTILTQVGSMSA